MLKRLSFLTFVLLACLPALVLAQDAAPDWTQVGLDSVGALAGVASLTTAMVYLFRALFSKIPGSVWPYAAPFIGQIADVVVAFLGNGHYNPVFGALAGFLSIAIHEAVTKHGERLLMSGGRFGRSAFLVAAATLVLAPGVHAQTFEALTNPNVVAGASYLTTDPVSSQGFDLHRVHFVLTANVAGVKVSSLPLYVGGVGVDIRTIDESFGSISGAGLSVPLVTYYFKGDQFLAQIGWATDLTGEEKSKTVYVGIGFSMTSPNKQEAKREAKRAARLRALPQARLAEAGPVPFAAVE